MEAYVQMLKQNLKYMHLQFHLAGQFLQNTGSV